MLIRASLLATACLLPAMAEASDSRVRSLRYDPGAIVTVSGRTNIQSTILFGEEERIENVAIGDSAAWQVTPNKRANLLFLKPQSARGRTNMTVVTDRHTYLFDLVAHPGGAPALYTLRFTYPAPPPAPPPAVPTIIPVAVAAPATSPTDLNFRWTQKGAKHLLPGRLFDDGKAVYLAWNAGVAMPAMLGVAPDGTEGPVNYSVRGEFVVVDGVPGRLVLRSGKAVAVLDRAAAPASQPRPTRTAER